MNTQEIENMIERYFEGQTSLEEERELKRFFSSGEVPAGLRKYQAHFTYLVSDSRQVVSKKKRTRRITDINQGKLVHLLPGKKRSLVYWLSGIAAGIALIVTVFLKSDPYVKQLESTYTDPEVAYNETKKVLMFVSAKLNRGTSELNRLAELDRGAQELNNLSKLDQGIQETSGTISKYNKIEKIINP